MGPSFNEFRCPEWGGVSPFKKSKVESVYPQLCSPLNTERGCVYKVPCGTHGRMEPYSQSQVRAALLQLPSAGLTQGALAFALVQLQLGPGSGEMASEFSFGLRRDGEEQVC